MERLVIRPRSGRLVTYLVGIVAFVVLGGWLVVSGGVVAKVFGVLGILFFGGGGLVMVVGAVRHGLAKLTLTPAGVELTAGGTVPWEDVEAVGVVTRPTTVVWLRLGSYDRYLASLPADRPVIDPAVGLSRLGRGSGRHGDVLRWNRKRFGYDMALSPAWLDRPAPAFAELLEEYRTAAGAAGTDEPARGSSREGPPADQQ
jgi:hypothetical protein